MSNVKRLLALLVSVYAVSIHASFLRDKQDGLYGISELFAFSPQTAEPMRMLAQVLLQNESTLTRGERELIASYVSSLNRCVFCYTIHSAIAKHLLEDDADLVDAVKEDLETAPVSEKLRALLVIAALVQQNGKMVTSDHIEHARAQGATDKEIHDTVLITAAFCMYNRYVDGLASTLPPTASYYDERGKLIAQNGYIINNNAQK